MDLFTLLMLAALVIGVPLRILYSRARRDQSNSDFAPPFKEAKTDYVSGRVKSLTNAFSKASEAFPAEYKNTLMVGLAAVAGIAVIFAFGGFQGMFNSSSNNSSNSPGNVSNNSGTSETEPEPAPAQPSQHQEERCKQDYVSGGYDQDGNYIDGEWVTVCQWVWVND